MKAALYTTKKGDEYLIGEDRQLIAKNKQTPSVERTAALTENPEGLTKIIRNALDIPLQATIKFFSTEDMKRWKKRKGFLMKGTATDPIRSRRILTKEQARDYLFE